MCYIPRAYARLYSDLSFILLIVGSHAAAPEAVERVGVVGEVLHGVKMSSLRKGNALVFLAQGLAGGGAVDEGDAEFPGETVN